MKKTVLILLAALICIFPCFTACESEPESAAVANTLTPEEAYRQAVALGYSDDLESFLASIRGANGVSITNITLVGNNLAIILSNGEVIDCGNIKGEKGDKGDPGVSIVDMYLKDNHLYAVLSDGKIVDYGVANGGGSGNTGGSDSPDTDDSTLTVLNNAMQAYASSCQATVIIESADSVVSKEFTTIVYDEFEEAESTIRIPTYNYIETDDNGNFVLPDNPSTSVGGSVNYTYMSVNFSGITFDEAYFMNGDYTYDSNTFSATITDCDGFFGTDLTQSEAHVQIVFRNGVPKSITLGYVDVAGYTVIISLLYDY